MSNLGAEPGAEAEQLSRTAGQVGNTLLVLSLAPKMRLDDNQRILTTHFWTHRA